MAALALALALAAPAGAAFPYDPDGDPDNGFQFPPGDDQAPNDLRGKLEWMYAATPEPENPNNAAPGELGGVRGAHVVDDADVDTAWRTTTGRPDVTIAVLDSGIQWNDDEAMRDLRNKTRLNKGELPKPARDADTPLEELPGGMTCDDFADGVYDANKDGVFSVSDYACDKQVDKDPAKGVGPADVLDPQDILIAFSNHTDGNGNGETGDRNGFVDDIVGWDFLDDDNDPYDDVQYGHGTGEASDSAAEADNATDEQDTELGTCPNCMVIHMRVGDSFIADESRFAQAVIYATDNDALVVQEALGTLNHTSIARKAVEYAYRHGVAVIASAADEAAQHHNWPSNEPHVIVVNSVTKYDDFTRKPQSYLQFNGCTNFMSKIAVAIPSVSCSSDATGRGSGMAGLIYSAALNASERTGEGRLDEHPGCRRTNGEPCVISANEVRQLMASGIVGGEPQADDVDFSEAELSCSPPAPSCTDPNLNAVSGKDLVAPFPATFRYPTRAGHEQFFGYGRVNMNRAVDAVDPSGEPGADASEPQIPPEVEITGPDWYRQVDPGASKLDVRGTVASRSGSYKCQLYVAPGSMPHNSKTPTGDFQPVDTGHCNGSVRSSGFGGVLGTIDVAALRDRFPADADDFRVREPGAGAGQIHGNGRPNAEPYGFTVRVVATPASGSPACGEDALCGQDRRNFYLHRDQDMLPGFPKQLPSDGEASPLFVDLDGDNRNELVVATADGAVHAYRRDGSELKGWPVRGDRLPLHTGGRAFNTGAISVEASRGAIIASPAAADLDHDGTPEVVAADLEGRLYAWNAQGKRLFTRHTVVAYSGKPLEPFVNVRQGKRNRTQRGFIGSPVLVDLDRDDGGTLEIVAAAMDRHVYAWNHDGSRVSGFPAIVVDKDKVDSIDPETHAVSFDESKTGDPLDQGAIIDTPAVGNIAGDARPEIVVGTNEEYLVDEGNEGSLNVGAENAASIALLTESGVAKEAGLEQAHGRVYAIKPGGTNDGDLVKEEAPPYVTGWPVKVARLAAELLPVVGEGITGAPVIGPAECGGDGPKVGTIPDAGIGYIFNPNGTSCLGKDQVNDKDVGLQTDLGENPEQQDLPVFPAVGHPAFGNFAGGISFLSPAAGLRRALDLAVNEYQQGSQDFVAAWDTNDGNFRTGFPSRVNDLQFLTGPSIANIDGSAGEEAVAGTASLDLTALKGSGEPVNSKWPKLTSDWMVANPLIGTFGTHDTDSGAKKTVVALTRNGSIFAYQTSASPCSPGSWPRFHHDNANSGDYRRDAVAPGKPENVRVEDGELLFTAPGDDLLCGTAERYELVGAGGTAGAQAAGARAARVRSAGAAATQTEPKQAGTTESIALPTGSGTRVGVRAIDEQGNLGRTAFASIQAGEGPGADEDGDDGGDQGGRDEAEDRGGGRDNDQERGDVSAGPALRDDAGDDHGGVLPFTGLLLAGLVAVGIALLTAGSLLRRRARRRS